VKPALYWDEFPITARACIVSVYAEKDKVKFSLRTVCKEWYELMRVYVKKICVKDPRALKLFPNAVCASIRNNKWSLKDYGNIREIMIDERHVRACRSYQLLEGATKLQSITWNSGKWQNSSYCLREFYEDIISQLRLESLTIIGKTDHCANCKQLFRKMTYLRNVCMRNCKHISDESILDILQLPNLEKLILHNVSVTGFFSWELLFAYIRTAKNLKYIELSADMCRYPEDPQDLEILMNKLTVDMRAQITWLFV
jgi:hypothetical protein